MSSVVSRRKAADYLIRPVLEHYGIHVNSRGKALCAWHDETRPSLSTTKYGYRCFTCGASGDAIKLIREQEDLSYQDAVERAEALTGGAGGRVSQPDRGQWGGDLLGGSGD